MKMMQRVWGELHTRQERNPHVMHGLKDSHLAPLLRYEEASEEERAKMFLSIAEAAYERGRRTGFDEGYKQSQEHVEETLTEARDAMHLYSQIKKDRLFAD